MVTRPLDRSAVLGVVLAGGASSRFGHDKALARLGGVRLIDGVVARARAQTGGLVISGNRREIADIEMIPDAAPAEGPLTGVLSALRWAGQRGYSAIATFPCDGPFFPDNLVTRLGAALNRSADCGFARCRRQRHATFAVWSLAALDRVAQAYTESERSLIGMQDRIGAVGIDFAPGDGPDGDPFFNINRQADLAVAEAWLEPHSRTASRVLAPPGLTIAD